MNRNIITIAGYEDVHQCGVYKIFHLKRPDDFYIGSSSVHHKRKGKRGFALRFKNHLYQLRCGKHHSKLLQFIYDSFGVEGIRMQILEITEPDSAMEREQNYLDRLIPTLNTYKNAFGSLGSTHSEISKKKMSLIRKGRKPSVESVRKISESMKDKRPKNYFMLHTKESRIKSAAKMRGRKYDVGIYESRSKKVIQFDLVGNQVAEFISVKQACNVTGINHASVVLSANGTRKTGGGFMWKYALDNGLSVSKFKKEEA